MVEGDTICSKQGEIHLLCHYLQVVLCSVKVVQNHRETGSISSLTWYLSSEILTPLFIAKKQP